MILKASISYVFAIWAQGNMIFNLCLSLPPHPPFFLLFSIFCLSLFFFFLRPDLLRHNIHTIKLTLLLVHSYLAYFCEF